MAFNKFVSVLALLAGAVQAAMADPFLGERVDQPELARATFEDYAEPYFPKPDLENIDPYWHPYLERWFEEGLSPAELALSRKQQRAGECETVLTLEMKGFLALYPVAEPDFHSSSVREIFATEIVPAYSPGYRRCVAFSRLNLLIEQTKQRYGVDETFMLYLPYTSLTVRYGKERTTEELRLERAALTLLSLAVCYRYRPAIDDVRFLIDELRVFNLYGAELLYFHEMAVKAGQSYPKLDILAGEAYEMLKKIGVNVIEDGRIYKRLGPGGFVYPEEIAKLCKIY